MNVWTRQSPGLPNAVFHHSAHFCNYSRRDVYAQCLPPAYVRSSLALRHANNTKQQHATIRLGYAACIVLCRSGYRSEDRLCYKVRPTPSSRCTPNCVSFIEGLGSNLNFQSHFLELCTVNTPATLHVDFIHCVLSLHHHQSLRKFLRWCEPRNVTLSTFMTTEANRLHCFPRLLRAGKVVFKRFYGVL